MKITIDEFHRLPRNSAFKYEYLNGEAWLSPRPKTFNGILDLKPTGAATTHRVDDEVIAFRQVAERDWEEFPKLFAAAFHGVQPFMSLGDTDRLAASRECLEQTRSGGDGPLVDPASFVAESSVSKRVVGAILITLIPRAPEGDWWDGKWDVLPETDNARRLLGRPHLTWVFVAPAYARHGLGSMLLAQSVDALQSLGYFDLGTTFLVGNDASALWHWRNGFRLLPYPGSPRNLPTRLQALSIAPPV